MGNAKQHPRYLNRFNSRIWKDTGERYQGHMIVRSIAGTYSMVTHDGWIAPLPRQEYDRVVERERDSPKQSGLGGGKKRDGIQQ